MKFATASVLAALWLASGPALAGPAGGAASAAYKDIVPKLVMVDADLRGGLNLDGAWRYSVDPYKDGLADFLGKSTDVRHGRGADIVVADVEKANPNALFEYDLGNAPLGEVPS